MTIAYLLPVHRGPAQVARLVHRLATDDTVFVLHVDARAGRAVQDEIARCTVDLPAVAFVDRHRCYWGGFGMVRATLKCLRHLMAHDIAYDYAVLVSGQDYPLRPAREIERFFAGAGGKSYMDAFPLPRQDGWGPRGGLDRVEDWHLIRRRALHLGLPRPRRVPYGLAPFGGSAWWALARPVAQYVDAYVREHPGLPRFFEHALHPSELFFQTVVMNSPHAGGVVNESLRFVRWANDARNPVTLSAADLDELLGSGMLFARKFDLEADAAALDALDAHLDRVAADVC